MSEANTPMFLWGNYAIGKDGLLVSSRSETQFILEPKFKKAVKDFGPMVAAVILADIEGFETDWHNGMEDEQLFARYNFKHLRDAHRPFGLFQIRVGPKRKHLSYRATVMFYDKQLFARWIYAFKKEENNETEEVKLAIARADECWNRIKGV